MIVLREVVDSKEVRLGEEQGHPVFERELKLGNLWGLGEAVGLKL